MAKKSIPLSPKANIILKTLGKNIKTARKRRSLSLAEMSSRMYVTQQTLIRLEAGEPGVSLQVLINALHVLGLENSLSELANPMTDELGLSLEKRLLPEKIRKNRKTDIDLDF